MPLAPHMRGRRTTAFPCLQSELRDRDLSLSFPIQFHDNHGRSPHCPPSPIRVKHDVGYTQFLSVEGRRSKQAGGGPVLAILIGTA
jgi:hypothetical protein